MSSPRIPPPKISCATHEWRMLFVLLEYFEGLPSNAARELWLDRLHALRPSLFYSLLQLQQLRESADACGFMLAPAIATALLRRRVDDLRRGSLRDV